MAAKTVSGAEGANAKVKTIVSCGMPLLERCQLTPPSVLRNTPAPPVPASTIDGFAGDAASPYTVPPYSRAEVQVLTPASAGGAGTAISSADSPGMKIRGNRRRIHDSTMNPCTTSCGLCPSHNARINPIV